MNRRVMPSVVWTSVADDNSASSQSPDRNSIPGRESRRGGTRVVPTSASYESNASRVLDETYAYGYPGRAILAESRLRALCWSLCSAPEPPSRRQFRRAATLPAKAGVARRAGPQGPMGHH